MPSNSGDGAHIGMTNTMITRINGMTKKPASPHDMALPPIGGISCSDEVGSGDSVMSEGLQQHSSYMIMGLVFHLRPLGMLDGKIRSREVLAKHRSQRLVCLECQQCLPRIPWHRNNAALGQSGWIDINGLGQ